MMNRVMLVGVVDRDATLTYTNNGTPICKFTLLCETKYTTKQGEQKSQRHFQPISAFGTRAETISQQATKGAMLAVQGKLQHNDWVDQQNQKHRVTEVIADLFDGVTVIGATDSANAKPAAAQQPASVEAKLADEDEVPF